MHIVIRLLSLCLIASLLSVAVGWAEPNGSGQDKEAAPKDAAKPSAGVIPDAKDKPVLTHHTVTIAGQRVGCTAETGMLPLLKADGTVRASIFYVAYTRQDAGPVDCRPVTFCFNGGPGASSVWLHLGGLGPRRARLNEKDLTQPAPFGLVDNEFSVLHVTDLVFIDPVATGFSRPADESQAGQFFAKSPDIESVAEFIQLWTTRHDRWLSPKYLCGESYGVFRGAGVAHCLHSRYGLTLRGLMLVSGALDFSSLGGDSSCQVFLPAYTAVAHFHKKLPPDLQADLPKALAEAREFMRTAYASALFQGASMAPDQRARVAAKLARLTGLPARVVEDNNLRITSRAFRKELLRDQGLIVGRFDGRITGRDGNEPSLYPDFDPSLSAIDGALAAAMNAYVRDELKFANDLPYGILNALPWKHDPRDNVMEEFASEMKENPHLRVLILNGRCDLACPVDCIRCNIDHLDLDPAFRRNITYAEYASGHMMYINPPDLRKMQKDLEQFLRLP
jgi:carboxypeptidase C (cathepsin A)